MNSNRKTSLILFSVILIAALSQIFIFGNIPVLSDNLTGPDDYMRALRVQDWLSDPGVGGTIDARLGTGKRENLLHWSRLADLPLAAGVKIFTAFLPGEKALMAAATIIPLLLFGCFLWALAFMARPLTGAAGAVAAAGAVIIMADLSLHFTPGTIDHTALTLILTAAGLGFVLRMVGNPDRRLYPALAGLCFAAALVIAGESLPALAAATVMTGFLWLAGGQTYLRPCFIFSASLLTGAVALGLILGELLPLSMDVCDRLNAPYLIFLSAAPLFWSAAAILPEKFTNNIQRRILVGVLVGSILAAIVYILTGPCLRDPYGLTDEAARTLWLNRVGETFSYSEWIARGGRPVILNVFLFIGGIAGIVWHLRYAQNTSRLMAAVLLIPLAFAVTLTLFWQARFEGLGLALSAPGLVILFRQALSFALKKMNRLALTSAIVIFSLFIISIAIKPDTHTSGNTVPLCDIRSAAREVDKIPGAPVILSHANYGSEILFRTNTARVLAAPYHRNGEGIGAAHNFFLSENPSQALALAQKYNADLILLCAYDRPYWQSFAGNNETMAEMLWSGPLPARIAPMRGSKDGSYKLFRIIR